MEEALLRIRDVTKSFGGLRAVGGVSIDVKPGSWGGVAMGKKCHLGTRVSFETLPEDCQKLTMQDYLDLWFYQAIAKNPG